MAKAADAPVLAGYEVEDFTADGFTHPVYRKGTGPAVIVMAEIPGITPKVLEFADRVEKLGCTVVLPWLFGTPGREPSNGYGLNSTLRACISREFTVFAKGKASPVTDWLRALGRSEHERCGGPGIGAVGMCITGGFALAMAVDETLVAPVLSQPSLPMAAGMFRGNSRELGISADGLARVRERCESEDLCVLGLRFTGDPLVPSARFEHLREALGDNFVGVEIDSSKGNPYGNPRAAHSVLTEHLVEEDGHPTRDALDKVLELFRTKLLAA